jgi:hypothetical protein
MTHSLPSSVLTALVKSMPPGMLCAPWGAAARPPPPLLLPPVLPPAAVCRADVPLLLLPLLELPELLNPELPELLNPELPELLNPELPELVNPELPELLNPELPELVNPDPLLLWSKVEEVKELVSAARELDPMPPALNCNIKTTTLNTVAVQVRFKGVQREFKR